LQTLIHIKALARCVLEYRVLKNATGARMAVWSIFRGWLKRQADMRALEALGPDGRRNIAQP
jgi:hypothetical protein